MKIFFKNSSFLLFLLLIIIGLAGVVGGVIAAAIVSFAVIFLVLVLIFFKFLPVEKFFTYPVFLVFFLSIIGVLGFGATLKYHYDGGENYEFLRKKVLFISAIPMTIVIMVKHRSMDLNRLKPLTKHKDKKRFERFIENKRDALLLLPRYDFILSRSVVDIVDINNFEIIHTYSHDVDEMNSKITNTKEFPRIKIDQSKERFRYFHPLLFEDGSLISMSEPAFKLDFCSNLQWINDDERFHHSIMLDHEENIWIGGNMKPKSKYVKKYAIKIFSDDSIIKINTDGKILYNKSITEILIENNLVDQNIFIKKVKDPIHLNDIEPALNDTEYWKQGDVFISIRHQSAIIHYRPSSNQVINYITGPFEQQHDIDIISDKEISIFDNNNSFNNNEYSEILIYNFETKEFTKLFNNQLQKENFKTIEEGLSHIFKDGSLMVEEQNHGRIILLNNKGKKEWEFVNKDKNGDIGLISWSRIIEDSEFIENFKLLVKNKKCLN